MAIDSEHVLRVLHLFYEDVKLNKFLFPTQGKRLARFLVTWILNGYEKAEEFIFQEPSMKPVVQKLGFIDYYIKDFPHLKSVFRKQLDKVMPSQEVMRELLVVKGVSLEYVPCLSKALLGEQP